MASASEEVWVLGIHMTKFGKHPDLDTVDLASEAVRGALADGGVTMKDIGVIGAGNLMGGDGADRPGGPEAAGPDRHPRLQRVERLRDRGHGVAGGRHGRSRRARPTWAWPSASRSWPAPACWPVGAARATPTTWTPAGRYGAVAGVDGRIGTEIMPGVFAQIGMEYGHNYGGTSFELFAKISEKNHSHSTLNPLAAYTKKMSLDEIMNDVMIAYPNTRPMCSANCDGAAAAVVVSGSKLKTLSLEQQRRAVKISASILTTDPWEEACQILPNVNDLTRNAAAQAYEQAGVGPSDLNLVELHDCFATAELVHYDNLGLCERGGAADFFNSGATWRDGTTPVNVSGGLESKGHPIAATGIANVWEVATHLRGEGGDRQIEGAKVGLTHVIGLGSACGIHILEKSAA